jgi:hypothetical protein
LYREPFTPRQFQKILGGATDLLGQISDRRQVIPFLTLSVYPLTQASSF